MVRIFFLFIIPLSFSSCMHSGENVAESQEILPFEMIALSNTASFQETGKNWQVAGDVYANRKQEGHLEKYEGSGVLVNLPHGEDKSHFFTAFEHGDIELELDFLMPKGSNSGIYLQGRYEVQLLDSWGVTEPNYSDCGGIYQRWDENRPEGEQGYEGHSPRINASKAPGLWQHLSIRFKAPYFDENGQKVANAKFEKVVLNGVVVQENVEVTGPTRSAAFQDEQPTGPLMIQGDHGAVAFKNIHYKRYGDQQVTLENMEYQLYEGDFSFPDTLTTLDPQKEGKTDSLSYLINREYEKYAIRFTGTLIAPTSGDYLFKVQTTGGHLLKVDGKTLVDYVYSDYLTDDYSKVKLEEGEHAFEFVFIKNSAPWRKGMGLYYEGPEMPMQPLHAPGSIPRPRAPDPIIIKAEASPELLRGFMMHKQQKRTHCIAVGTPAKLHYAYDLSQGALLNAWSGSFVDVTDMWHERGEAQLAQPLGNVVEFFSQPSFALLPTTQTTWPDTMVQETSAYYEGYTLDSTGLPVFNYSLGETQIQDYLYPGKDGSRALHREINFKGNNNYLYCRMAEGNDITLLPDGSYAVDDKSYYLVLDHPENMIQRNVGSKKELLWPVDVSGGEASVKYTLIW